MLVDWLSEIKSFSLAFFYNREKAKLKEEIVARRQQQLLLRRARQQFLEEAALREAELIQKINRFSIFFSFSFWDHLIHMINIYLPFVFIRERTSEVEKELERQQLLELERARTRELRHSLDIEKEKQAQARLFLVTGAKRMIM